MLVVVFKVTWVSPFQRQFSIIFARGMLDQEFDPALKGGVLRWVELAG